MEFPEFQLRGVQVPPIYLSALTSWKENQPSRDDDSLGGVGHHGDQTAVEKDPSLGLRTISVSLIGASLLYSVTDLLQRIGHWRIARRFASILEILVQTDMNEDWMLV
jgi:hypothetical protein